MKLLRKKAPKPRWQQRFVPAKKDKIMKVGVLAATALGAAFLLERYCERFFILD